MIKRRGFLTGLFGILGIITTKNQEDYYNPTKRLSDTKHRFITNAERDTTIKSITINGEDITDKCFACLLHSDIELEYFESNIKGEKTYEKVGFKKVGRRRQSGYIFGKYQDAITMDILRSEWDALYPDYNLFEK